MYSTGNMFTSLVLYLRTRQRLLTLQLQLHIFFSFFIVLLHPSMSIRFFIVFNCRCQLALGDLEDASTSYMSCLNINTESSDPKIFAEVSDGLEGVKVSCHFFARAVLK
jgi:hypothetical protein